MLSGFKNFLVTFLAAALLFGIIAIVMTGYVSGVVTNILDGEQNKPTDIKGEVDETSSNDDTPTPDNPSLPMPDGSSFTFVAVGTDYYPDKYDDYFYNETYLTKATSKVKKSEDAVGLLSGTKLRYLRATWVALVRADRECREYAVCYFSPETEISSQSGVATLGDIYGTYGMDALCEYLTVLTGLDVNYRFVIDGMNEKGFLEAMGSVTFNTSEDLYTVGDLALTSSSKKAGHGKIADDTADTASETSKSAETKSSEPSSPAINAGDQQLTDVSIGVVNTLREYSSGDVELKSGIVLGMLKQYIERCADWPTEDFSWKIGDVGGGTSYTFGDPYETKPVLATDLTSDGAASIHSMLGAVKYFGYEQFICPGSFSDSDGRYIPDTKALSDRFSKYTNNSSDNS